MKRFIITVALTAFFLFSSAQDSTLFSRWAVTCQPSGFVDPWVTHFTIGVQYRLSEYIFAEVQGGVIKSWYCIPKMETTTTDETAEVVSREESDITKKGFRINAAIKVYPLPGTYFALQFLYNDYEKTDIENVWRFAQSYTQRMKLHKSITDVGGALKMGYVFEEPYLRFYGEAFAGLGLKYKTLNITNGLPDDAEIIVNEGVNNGGTLFNDVTGGRLLPAVVLGITIGFKL